MSLNLRWFKSAYSHQFDERWFWFLRDGIHLSADGSKIMVEEILKVLREAEWEPSLHWKSMPVEFGEDSPYDPVSPDGNTTVNLSNIPFPYGVEWD